LRGAAAPAGEAFGRPGAPSPQDVAEGADAFDPARLGAAALSILAALVVSFAPAAEAQAAKSGGRIGGSAQAARSKPPPARTSTNVINKTTVVEKNTTVVVPPPAPVVVAPPVVAPMGMGYGMGMAPVVVAPPPTLGEIVVGAAVSSAIHSAVVPHGPSVNDRILENQQRQDERQMDRQANQIEDLQRELAQLKAQK